MYCHSASAKVNLLLFARWGSWSAIWEHRRPQVESALCLSMCTLFNWTLCLLTNTSGNDNDLKNWWSHSSVPNHSGTSQILIISESMLSTLRLLEFSVRKLLNQHTTQGYIMFACLILPEFPCECWFELLADDGIWTRTQKMHQLMLINDDSQFRMCCIYTTGLITIEGEKHTTCTVIPVHQEC